MVPQLVIALGQAEAGKKVAREERFSPIDELAQITRLAPKKRQIQIFNETRSLFPYKALLVLPYPNQVPSYVFTKHDLPPSFSAL
jgi:hypothetical protein